MKTYGVVPSNYHRPPMKTGTGAGSEFLSPKTRPAAASGLDSMSPLALAYQTYRLTVQTTIKRGNKHVLQRNRTS
ncbi:hypothetical protein HQ584_01760 [Patescibacteria group bacterium]|nr:hypothetical protein [Patescibacteria group bacterium]